MVFYKKITLFLGMLQPQESLTNISPDPTEMCCACFTKKDTNDHHLHLYYLSGFVFFFFKCSSHRYFSINPTTKFSNVDINDVVVVVNL